MAKTALSGTQVPSVHNWRTTDLDEINRRKARAQAEEFRIANADPRHPIFSNFRIESGSGLTYSVEIRDLRQPQFACEQPRASQRHGNEHHHQPGTAREDDAAQPRRSAHVIVQQGKGRAEKQ